MKGLYSLELDHLQTIQNPHVMFFSFFITHPLKNYNILCITSMYKLVNCPPHPFTILR